MAWRLANSLVTFRNQLNSRYPNRNKASDGFIGDAAHQAQGSASDHNPWVRWNGQEIVTAGDFTKDLGVGVDTNRITDELERSRDNRIKYVIANGFLMSGDDGPSPWQWRRRPDGSDYGHHQHMHISVKSDARFGDDSRPWAIPTFGAESEENELDANQRQALLDIRWQLRSRWYSFLEIQGGGNKDDGLTKLEFEIWNHANAGALDALSAQHEALITQLEAKVAAQHDVDVEVLKAELEAGVQEGIDEAEVNIKIRGRVTE